MEADNTFAGHYSLSVIENLDAFTNAWEFPAGRQINPATVERLEFTPTWKLNGHPEIRGETILLPAPVCVKISAEGSEPWLGVFHSNGSGMHTTAVTALPDRETFAVISDGDAYRVWASEPGHWSEISPGGGYSEPLTLPELELVVLADFTTLVAYGPSGPVWESERLVWDDLRVLGVDQERLLMQGFDAPKNAIVPFSVDLRTGRSEDAPHPERRLRRVDRPM